MVSFVYCLHSEVLIFIDNLRANTTEKQFLYVIALRLPYLHQKKIAKKHWIFVDDS